jgi:hypothetical protein
MDPLSNKKEVYSPILRVTRLEFDDCKNPGLRERSEVEAARDLEKPIEQLLADVHEEAEGNTDEGRIAGALKRLVSMQVQVVRANNRAADAAAKATSAAAKATSAMVALTWAIFVLTLVMTVLTYLMWRKA